MMSSSPRYVAYTSNYADMIYSGGMAAKKKAAENAKKKELMEGAVDKRKKELKEIYEDFQTTLLNFAKANPKDIKSNPEFRSKFNQMCIDLGVDPMPKKLFGRSLVSAISTIKVYRICISKRKMNGGLMKIADVIEIYNKRSENKITRQDVEKALESISILGSALRGEYICTVPIDLSSDSMDLFAAAENNGYVSASIMSQQGWSEERFHRQIDQMLSEGLVWIDSQTGNRPHYYFPSMWANK